MNFQCDLSAETLRVLIVNSMSPAAKFLAIKILNGEIFGNNQLIDITLMVYSNEQPKAMGLKCELDKCAFACTNSIEVSSDLPRPPSEQRGSSRRKQREVGSDSVDTHADVFCFITNFENPNTLDFSRLDNDRHLDMLELLINIAKNLQRPAKEEQGDEMVQKEDKIKRKHLLPDKKACKPIFIADGLVAIHVLKSFSKDMPSDVFFCPTPISAIAKSVLGEYLKVQCTVLNDVFVWAANDEIFHVEFEKPLIIHDKMGAASPCDSHTVGKDLLASMNLDHTQFNSAWLKKDLIAKTVTVAQKNPYGSIYKAALVARTLQRIWLARLINEKIYTNMGVISDGSLESIKGYPYVLPVVLSGDTCAVNRRFEEDVHLKQEFKRINKTVKEFHGRLMPFCKKLLFECGSSLLSLEEEESQQIALQ